MRILILIQALRRRSACAQRAMKVPRVHPIRRARDDGGGEGAERVDVEAAKGEEVRAVREGDRGREVDTDGGRERALR